MTNPIEVKLLLTDAEALALAQFVKRAHSNTWGELAVDDQEAALMKDGLASLQKALREAGYAPR